MTHENKRLVSQQGIFTYFDDVQYGTIEQYLEEFCRNYQSEILENEMFLLKITVPEKQRELILGELNLMNINQAALFPDVNGAAQHCNYLFGEIIDNMKAKE